MAKSSLPTSGFGLIKPGTWARAAKPVSGTTTLGRRHVYIFPTRFGWLYALLLLALLIGSINYSLSAGFMMTFLLAGLGIIAMLHTWRNLAHLEITSHRAPSVFAGDPVVFEFMASNKNRYPRYAITARFADLKYDPNNLSWQDIDALGTGIFKLTLPSEQRGWLKAPRLIFATEFPLSLLRAWAYVEVENQCLVYPRPSLHNPPIYQTPEQNSGHHHYTIQGDDDFAGHRSYQFGDSPKRIDWKAASRQQTLLTKQFRGEASLTIWLDWAETSGLHTEQRISELARWVVEAYGDGLQYGMRLPHLSINPNSGHAHYHQCLSALALM